jgi:phosphoglycerate kinase
MNTTWQQHCAPDLRTLQGKRVIVRVDWNVPVADNVVTDTTRIDITIPFLKSLSAAGAKIVLMTHFGEKGESLLPVANHITKALSFITFTPTFNF